MWSCKKEPGTFNDNNEFDAAIMRFLSPDRLRSTAIKKALYDAYIGPNTHRKDTFKTPSRHPRQKDTKQPPNETPARLQEVAKRPPQTNASKTDKGTLASVMGDIIEEDKPQPPQPGQRFTSEEDRIINEKLKRLAII